MRNQQHRCIQFLFQFVHHLKHLRLNGHIQCSCWFVCQQQFRFARKCHCNNYPLLHTTGELMRIFTVSFPGDSNHFKHFNSFRLCFCFRYLIMQTDSFCNLFSDCHDRIKSCHRILKNHRNLISFDMTHFPVR